MLELGWKFIGRSVIVDSKAPQIGRTPLDLRARTSLMVYVDLRKKLNSGDFIKKSIDLGVGPALASEREFCLPQPNGGSERQVLWALRSGRLNSTQASIRSYI